MLRKKYQTVFIDWDGTLSLSRFWQHWQDRKPQAYQKIQSQFFVNQLELVQQWMRGQIVAEEVVKSISPSISLSGDTLLDGLRQSCHSMQFISDEIPTQILKLRQSGYRVVIATDNMDTFPRWTVGSLQLTQLFDDILDSHTLGYLKADISPSGDSAFFQSYLQQHSLVPQECVLIDDSPSSIQVQDFGLDVIQIKRGDGLTAAINQINSQM